MKSHEGKGASSSEKAKSVVLLKELKQIFQKSFEVCFDK